MYVMDQQSQLKMLVLPSEALLLGLCRVTVTDYNTDDSCIKNVSFIIKKA